MSGGYAAYAGGKKVGKFFVSGFGLRERAKHDQTDALFQPRNTIDLLPLSDTWNLWNI